MLEAVSDFMAGGSFPVIALSLLLFTEFLVIGIVLVPAAPTGLGAFAEDFRIWCCGYDPATGRIEWAYVMAMLLPQFMLGAFIVVFWWQPLRQALEHPRRVAAQVAAALLLVTGSAAGFAFAEVRPASGELPFPAEALRMAHPAPQLDLTNQAGKRISLEALQGKVVVLTAVYASCGRSCPALLAQTKTAVQALTPAERENLRVVAVTIDPEHDSQADLAELAMHHGMNTPVYNLVTGAVDRVEHLLDQMEVARRVDPETGMIEHANIVLLIDRRGKVAYRLGLGARQQRWLGSALHLLLGERPS